MNETALERHAAYPTTIWSEVNRAAGKTDTPEALAALGNLLRRYSMPLRAHLVFKFHAVEDQAAEWLQEFIHRKVLLAGLLQRASKERGKFRTFLLNALDNFIISEQRKENAQQRRPEAGLVSLEELSPTESDRLARDVEDRFASDWARAVLAEALERLETDCASKDAQARWGFFKERLVDPLLTGSDAPPYEQLVSKFGFTSPAEAANALNTAKRRFRTILVEVVTEYSDGQTEAGNELHELMAALSRGA